MFNSVRSKEKRKKRAHSHLNKALYSRKAPKKWQMLSGTDKESEREREKKEASKLNKSRRYDESEENVYKMKLN